jgi:hypothetical protein
MFKFGSMFFRNYHHPAYKSHDYILSAYLGNPLFMEAKLKNHIKGPELEDLDPQQLKATLDDLFVHISHQKFNEGLDKGLFNIKHLTLCSNEQRFDYLNKLKKGESIKLEMFVKPKNDEFDLDSLISRFSRNT